MQYECLLKKRKRFFQHPRLNVSHELHHGSQGGCILAQKCANMKTKTLFLGYFCVLEKPISENIFCQF